MRPQLRLPPVLAVVAVVATSAALAVATASCGDDDSETCQVYCVPDGLGGGSNCQPPYPCATGPQQDQCPAGCIPEPVA